MGKNKKHNQVNSNEEKKLSTTKVVYLVVFLLFAGMILLYSSDTFKSLPKGSSAGTTANSGNPHAGADLSQLDEIKRLEQVLDSNPNDHQSMLKLGHLYNDSGFKQKAIDIYTKYLQEHPGEADVIVDMSVCYYDLNNNEKALELLDRAISLKPDHQIAHFNKGIVHFSAGNMAEAKESWQNAINIDPNSEVGKRAEELSKSH